MKKIIIALFISFSVFSQSTNWTGNVFWKLNPIITTPGFLYVNSVTGQLGIQTVSGISSSSYPTITAINLTVIGNGTGNPTYTGQNLTSISSLINDIPYITPTSANNLTNKTITSPVIVLSSNAQGDMYYNSITTPGLGRVVAPVTTASGVLAIRNGIPVWKTTTFKGSVAMQSATNDVVMSNSLIDNNGLNALLLGSRRLINSSGTTVADWNNSLLFNASDTVYNWNTGKFKGAIDFTNATVTGLPSNTSTGSNTTITGSNAATVTGSGSIYNVNVAIPSISGSGSVSVSGTFPIFTVTSSALTNYQTFTGVNETITGNGTVNPTITGLPNPTITGANGILVTGPIISPTVTGTTYFTTITGVNETVTGSGTLNITVTGLPNPTLSGTGGIVISGTILNPTINGSAFLTSYPSITGSNITVNGSATQSVTLTGNSYSAGSGISVSGANQIINTSQDKTVSIVGLAGNSVTSNYPNFTISGPDLSTSVWSITGNNLTSAGIVGSINGDFPVTMQTQANNIQFQTNNALVGSINTLGGFNIGSANYVGNGSLHAFSGNQNSGISQIILQNGITSIGSNVITFTGGPVKQGDIITGTNILANTYITSSINSTSAGISNAATGTATNITFTGGVIQSAIYVMSTLSGNNSARSTGLFVAPTIRSSSFPYGFAINPTYFNCAQPYQLDLGLYALTGTTTVTPITLRVPTYFQIQNLSGNNPIISDGTNQNIFLGFAGNTAVTGTVNACVGPMSGQALTGGSGNVFLGRASGKGITSGNQNVHIGDCFNIPSNLSATSFSTYIGFASTPSLATGLGPINNNSVVVLSANDDWSQGGGSTASNQYIFGGFGTAPSYFFGGNIFQGTNVANYQKAIGLNFGSINSIVSFAGTSASFILASGSTITMTGVTNASIGDGVSGTNIPSSTTIISINSTSILGISNSVTGSNSGTYTITKNNISGIGRATTVRFSGASGSATGGDGIFQTAVITTTGNSSQTFQDVLRITSTQRVGIGNIGQGNVLEALHVLGNLRVNHLVGNTSTPGIISGPGSGTSPTLSLSGSDLSGKIVVTTGTAPTGGAIVCTITFSVPFATAPYVVFSPNNSNAAALSGLTMVYATSTSTTFSFNVGGTGLAGSTNYSWNYLVSQ